MFQQGNICINEKGIRTFVPVTIIAPQTNGYQYQVFCLQKSSTQVVNPYFKQSLLLAYMSLMKIYEASGNFSCSNTIKVMEMYPLKYI